MWKDALLVIFQEASDQFSGGASMEVVYPRCSGLDVHKRFVVAALESHPAWRAPQRNPPVQHDDQRYPSIEGGVKGRRMQPYRDGKYRGVLETHFPRA